MLPKRWDKEKRYKKCDDKERLPFKELDEIEIWDLKKFDQAIKNKKWEKLEHWKKLDEIETWDSRNVMRKRAEIKEIRW